MILQHIQLSYYIKHYISFIIVCIFLWIPCSLYADTKTDLYIGHNSTGAIGYLHMKKLPFNQIYTVIDIKNLSCGGHIKGYTEQQGNRFIIHTDIPDPRKDSAHQCQVTFIREEQHLVPIKEENCAAWHEIGCSFISMDFLHAPKAHTIGLIKTKPVRQKN